MYRPTNNIGPIGVICMIFRVFVEASQFEMTTRYCSCENCSLCHVIIKITMPSINTLLDVSSSANVNVFFKLLLFKKRPWILGVGRNGLALVCGVSTLFGSNIAL